MNLLFSITDNYIHQLETTLFSIKCNNTEQQFDVYVLLANTENSDNLINLKIFCRKLGMILHLIQVPSSAFAAAPKSSRYPQTIYYRLIAQNFLPKQIDRILYLDCDLLCLNPFKDFYESAFQDNLYTAASHTENIKIGRTFNKIRLGNYDVDNYFNSGVLLMNLKLIRQQVNLADIYHYIDSKSLQLFLPDQDILNALYGDKIKAVADVLYNYDTRYFSAYKLLNGGTTDLDWVVQNTVFLHFCGQGKPWHKSYSGKFAALYKYYQWLVQRDVLAFPNPVTD
ncbi:glycosyltransferase family 8 protein [Oenococcus kitaharae]|uniref:Glycosyl transferase n=1 Tax=Oenococcus kitaharae DSM 17330 TaxID=1045004 RepID=G9WGG2_9LACO|nr:glycosyltransferase family 8 protein [Oenococcus kitaharae]EHN59789.1 Glycosyl transferase [Oenococcus kitaharae DSM 17330]OEY83608.1 glycosyl transferase [Oenococcus kitaharae]OEY85406.1 glycosyl transferase [Oenococcus kitaharae]OEY86259.1 glycosyl transferase [Oenococcus kitaharae]